MASTPLIAPARRLLPSMCPALCPLRPLRLVALLCGMALIGGLSGTSNPAPAGSAERPVSETIQQEAPSQDSPTDAPAQDPAPPTPEEESVGESVIEVLLGIFILGPIITIVLGLLLAFPAVLLGVSLVMDGGCFRYLLFGLGWIFAIFYGLLLGAIIGEMTLGLESLTKLIGYLFVLGYPVVAYWGHKKLQAMPEEQYRAWDQTLTGGALLGFGAGSIAGLLRSVGSSFGGFGGGSFGGGGASGSWSGASGTTGGVGAAGSASTTATGTTTTAAGSSAKATAVVAGATPGMADEDSPGNSTDSSGGRGFWTRLRRWFQKFQWYHGLAFILVTLVFVPLGLGTMRALQNTEFFVFVLVCVVVYSGYRFLRRNPRSTRSFIDSMSSFKGGEASSSWS